MYRLARNIVLPKRFFTSKIRNVGIAAHIDAGKTTTTECMLYVSGTSKFVGSVDDGSTVTDFLDEERQRGITIQSAAVNFQWKDTEINLIDTPGHIDFTSEVERTMSVLDGGVLVLDASAGVQTQTLTVFQQMNRYDVARICFVNKMDKYNANFLQAIESLKKRLNLTPVVLMLPLDKSGNIYNGGLEFAGFLDILDGSTYVWKNLKSDAKKIDDAASNFTESTQLSPELHDYLAKYREIAIEAVADYDDDIAERYLDGHEISSDEIRRALAKHVAGSDRKLIPVTCGSALGRIGVQNLLTYINQLLPQPQSDSDCKKFAQGVAQVFKIVHTGPRKNIAMAYFRVYTGSITRGPIQVFKQNSDRSKSAKISTLAIPQADSEKKSDKIEEGQVGVIKGSSGVAAGDIIARRVGGKFTAEEISVYRKEAHECEPIMYMSVELETEKDYGRVVEIFNKLCLEDPSLSLRLDEAEQQIVLGTQGQLHAEIIKSRVQRENNLEVTFGSLQINYHERSLKMDSLIDRTFKFEGRGVSAELKIQRFPEDDSNHTNQFQEISNDTIYIDETALKKSLESGALKSGDVYDVMHRLSPILKGAIIRKLSAGPIGGNPVRLPRNTRVRLGFTKLQSSEARVIKKKGATIKIEEKVDEGRLDRKIAGKQRMIKGTNVSRTALQQACNGLVDEMYSEGRFAVHGPVMNVEIVCPLSRKDRVTGLLHNQYAVHNLQEHEDEFAGPDYILISGQVELKAMESLGESLRKESGGETTLSTEYAGHRVVEQ